MKNWKEQGSESPMPKLRVIESPMPHNEHAEAVVLGTLIGQPRKLEEVMDVLHPSDFYTIRHKILYELMLDYYRQHGKCADFLVLTDLLEKNEDIDASDLMELMHLADELWSVDLLADVRLITGPAFQRRVRFASLDLAAIAHDIYDPDEARTAVEKLLYDLTAAHDGSADFDSLETILGECMTDIETAINNRGKMLGVPSGFTDLDIMTLGFQRTDLIILAGRPGLGKSAAAMGMGYNAAKRGHAVAAFSLEMGKKQLGLRLLSHVSRVPLHRLRAGWLDEDEREKVVEAQDELSELCFSIDDTAGTPIHSIRRKLRRLRAKIHRDIDLVIVDYLQLMEDEGENRNQEISRISRGLKLIAKEFNVPVLALAQLSRSVESRQNKRPQLSDLRDSGAIEQDADIVLFIYRDEVYNPDNNEKKGLAELIMAKHRNGPVGTVFLRFNGALTRFDNDEGTPTNEDERDDEE